MSVTTAMLPLEVVTSCNKEAKHLCLRSPFKASLEPRRVIDRDAHSHYMDGTLRPREKQ